MLCVGVKVSCALEKVSHPMMCMPDHASSVDAVVANRATVLHGSGCWVMEFGALWLEIEERAEWKSYVRSRDSSGGVPDAPGWSAQDANAVCVCKPRVIFVTIAI